MFKVTIIGSHNENDYSLFEQKCKFYLKNKAKNGIIINTIGDVLTIRFATKYNIEMNVFNCDWQKYGKETLKHRNQEILDDSEALILFDAVTKDNKMIKHMAEQRSLPCRIIKK